MITGVRRVPRVGGIAIEDNANLTAIGRLELITVDLDGTTVSEKKVVTNDPGLGAAVPNRIPGTVRSAARGELAYAVAEDRRAPRFVEGDPVLALGEGLVADASIVLEVKRELLAVQETAIALV